MAFSFMETLTGGLFASERDKKRLEKIEIIDRQHINKYDCFEEIGNCAVRLVDEINNINNKRNVALIPPEIVKGPEFFPLYAFLLAIECQKGKPSPDQSYYLDIFFNNFHLGFTKQDFISAATEENAVRKLIEDAVGISKNSAGAFWPALFKGMTVTGSDEDVLHRVIGIFIDMFSLFMSLGDGMTTAAQKRVKRFQLDVFAQYDERIKPEDHYKRMKDICMSLAKACNNIENIELFPIYSTLGFIYKIITTSKAGEDEYPHMLDHAIKVGNIDAPLDAEAILNCIRDEDAIGALIKQMVIPDTEVFWKYLIILGHEAKMQNEAMDYIEELVELMTGTGAELTKKFPDSGVLDIVKPYMSEVVESGRNLMKGLNE